MRVLRLCSLLAVSFLFACRFQSDLRDRVEAQVNNRLLVGSSPDAALHFLDSLGLEHSAYLRQTDRIITANFGESYRLLSVSSNVYLTLFYDEHDRLSRADVEEIMTGP